MKNNISKPITGLNLDRTPQEQPEGTYRFALNAVVETEEGRFGVLSNEQANEFADDLPFGFLPIGKVYMPGGDVAIFSVNEEESLSEIGILDRDSKYTTYVKADLGFKVTNQIDAQYKLRRGCERTIYWVDGDNNVPRIYNFDKPEDFKNSLGGWDPDKFSLVKTYDKIPVFDEFEILETGTLSPGSYNFAVQYLDEDLNPTEWITASDTTIIYNDNPVAEPFPNVRGSTGQVSTYQEFGNTNKSIRVVLSNLDEAFPFYRLAIIEATTGNGEITQVAFSEEVSIKINAFIYTGTNAASLGTIEEVQQFATFIESADHIEQIENRLVLANVRGKTINWCNLQKYASKIKADLALEPIILNNLSIEDNPKRAALHNEKVGYMPGEIYSFGIIYILEGNVLSPVFHIPGRNPNYLSDMSSDNELDDTFYVDNESCEQTSYWGVDGQGIPLEGKPIRHHRFPLRSEIQEPLINSSGDTTVINNNTLILNITGEVDPGYLEDSVDYLVTYLTNGNLFQVQLTFDLTDYDPLVGSDDIVIVNTIGEVSLVEIKELDEGVPVDPDANTGLTYNSRVENLTTNLDDSVFTSNIMGVTFSDIDLPNLEDTNGNKVIGYYIVRNNRREEDKTILDTGVIAPLLIEEREGVSKFVAHGHLMPESDKIKEDTFALIHPEHKFLNKEYTVVSSYIQQGEYIRTSKNLSDEIVQDVQPGTSYDAENNQRRERDSDGFDLHVLTRNNNVEFNQVTNTFAEGTEINESFYLNTLFSKSITDTDGNRKDIYNVSADNKIGIVSLNEKRDKAQVTDKLPFVVMKRNLANPYANFRVLPYIKEQKNPFIFTSDTGNVATVFNGDSYISSMRYTSSMFYDIRLRSRRTRSGVLGYIIGVLAVVAGTVLIATGVGVVAGVAVIGLGVASFSSGLKRDQLSRVYQDLYEQGLKDTVNDDDTDNTFGGNPPDDEIQHFTDVATNLWFESGVNMNWRSGATVGITDFLDSPSAYDESQLITYAIEKVTGLDASADGGRTYQGYTKAEIYDINLDYLRREREKLYFHLASEFDCCSECLEEFPHRVQYSEQSFQEELTDNYRIFLPNNYKDITGETGEVTNLFTIQNNLYIQTEEALWHIPQNIQERSTGDIVSFIGTGEFLAIPPRKILDDETGNSGGCQHKWGVLKTPYGVMFPSERQRAIFLFNGNNLSNISSKGLFSWFKNNLPIQYDQNYYSETGQKYPYANNPSNLFGTGFISTYDSRNERIILTKKDFLYSSNLSNSNEDYRLCNSGEDLIIFRNYSQIIQQREANGWTFLGIEDDCRLKFQRVMLEEQEVETVTKISNSTDIHVFFDTSGSFGSFNDVCLQSINQAIDSWINNFASDNPDWTGQLYKYQDSSERWVNYAEVIATTTYAGQDLSEKDIIVISFCNEASPSYHGSSYMNGISSPSPTFDADYNNFVNSIYPAYRSFIGIAYPIVFGENSGSCSGLGAGSQPTSKEFLKHSIAAVYGTELTALEVGQILPGRNPGFNEIEWAQMINDLQTNNPYPDVGLSQYGWVGKWDRAADAQGNVINELQFNVDISQLLNASFETEVETILVPSVEVEYEEGELFEEEVFNNSWTMSYNLKTEAWVGWHSYLPSFYIHASDRFYSVRDNDRNIYKHNVVGKYQNYYFIRRPFVVDYVSNSSPLQTRIWNHINFLTEAEVWNPEMESFYQVEDRTFNKAILYNSTQCSGLMILIPKDSYDDNYLLQQVKNLGFNTFLIDFNEKNWSLNDLRDIRVDYNSPIFKTNIESKQPVYYIDKVLNEDSLDEDKDWRELTNFRDKYLSIRLIFDNFEDTKLLLNYSVENEQDSIR